MNARILDTYFPSDITNTILRIADDTLIILLLSEREEIVQVACIGDRKIVKSWLHKHDIKFDVDRAIKIDEIVDTKEMLNKFVEGNLGIDDEET